MHNIHLLIFTGQILNVTSCLSIYQKLNFFPSLFLGFLLCLLNILSPLCSFLLILHVIFSDSSYHFSIFHKTFYLFFPLNFFLAVLCGLQDLSFLTRDWAHTSCISRWSLDHWTTSKIPSLVLPKWTTSLLALSSIYCFWFVFFVVVADFLILGISRTINREASFSLPFALHCQFLVICSSTFAAWDSLVF